MSDLTGAVEEDTAEIDLEAEMCKQPFERAEGTLEAFFAAALAFGAVQTDSKAEESA